MNLNYCFEGLWFTCTVSTLALYLCLSIDLVHSMVLKRCLTCSVNWSPEGTDCSSRKVREVCEGV